MDARAQLEAWVDRYRGGELLSHPDALPEQPAGLQDSDEPLADQSSDTGSSHSTDLDDVARARRLFSVLGFAAPRPLNESERVQTIFRMGLLDVEHNETIQRAYRLAVRCVPADSHVFLSLVAPDSQRIIAGEEEGPLAKGKELARDGGFCAHTILSKEGMDVPDTAKDWRFQKSPFVQDGTIGSYSGLPLTARRVSANSDNNAYPLGAFCVYSPTARQEGESLIDAETRKILEDLAGIVSKEFEAHGLRLQRAKELKMRAATEALLERSTFRTGDLQTDDAPFFDDLTKNVCEILECAHSSIIDLRSFSHSHSDDFLGSLKILGFYSRSLPRDVFEATLRQGDKQEFEALMAHLQAGGGGVYNKRKDLMQSPFARWVNERTQCFFAAPLYDPAGELVLMITASSTEKYDVFSSSDVIFLSNTGKVALMAILRERLLQADAAKTAFVARISHELRTPLHGLSSQISLLRDALITDASASSPVRSMLDTADVCTQTLGDVVEDVLYFGKVQSAMDTQDALQQVRERSRVELASLLLDLVRITVLRQKQFEAVNSEDALDVRTFVEIQQLPDWTVDIDRSGFERCLLNILTNSFKFTSRGSVTATMRLTPDRAMCELIVADTGRGMSAAFLRDAAFRPFQQEHNFAQGTGLGLSIVQGIVSRMSGTIKISSKEGVGTTVYLAFPISLINPPAASAAIVMQKIEIKPPERPLPLAELPSAAPRMPLKNVAESTSKNPRVSSPPSSEIDDPRRLRCLLVDDNAVSRRVLTTVVGKAGVSYREACDGLQALEIFKIFRPHCVLTDVSMPVMDGIESAERMREWEAAQGWRRAHIVAVSAHPAPKDLSPALDAWMVKGKLDIRTTRDLVSRMQADLLAATLTATSLLGTTTTAGLSVPTPTQSPEPGVSRR